MTAYCDRDRRAERGRLHRLVRRLRHLSLSKVNAWFFALVLLAVLVPGQAQAYPKNCKFIPNGQICESSITGKPTGRCDVGYEQMSDLSCKKLAKTPRGVQP